MQEHRPWRVGPASIARAAALLALLTAARGFSDTAFFETEPNDGQAEYNHVSGALTLYGTLAGKDQDGYLWTVSDDDARKRWTFELHGIPEAKLTQVSVMRLEYAENGVDVIGMHKLFDMGTRDGTRPSVHAGLIFDPGDYVLGIGQAGSTADDGAYRFFIREEPLAVSRNPAAGSAPETAYAIRPGGDFASFEADRTAWFSFEFEKADATSRWAISVQAPVGRKLQATLRDAQGEKLLVGRVDEKGRLSFRDLVPPEGTWYLELETPEPGMIQSIATEVTGARVAGQEAEPNNDRKQANRVDFSRPLSGRIGDGDSEDMFIFTVEDSDSTTLQTLRLESGAPKKLIFCLESLDWKDVQCRNGTPPLEMTDLLLSPGEWGLELRRARAQDYTITLEPQGPVVAGREVEPNDEVKYANGMPARMLVKGGFSGDDTDVFQFYSTSEAQLWRFQVNGEHVKSLAYLNGRGRTKANVRASKGDPRVRLDNLLLLPGRHFIEVRGTDGDYTLLARALGPPVATEEPESSAAEAEHPAVLQAVAESPEPPKPKDLWNPDGEVEPNDETNMQRMAVGQVRTGTLPDTEDDDHYHFFVANYDHLKLSIEPPPDGSIKASLSWYDLELGVHAARAPGEPIAFEGLLPPGDYHLALKADKPSDRPYRLKLERLPRFSCPKDCEPNGMGHLGLAAPLPPDLVLEGAVGEWRDDDIYQLPAFADDAKLLFRSDDSAIELRLLGPDGKLSAVHRHDPDLGGYQLTIPAGAAQRLVISGRSDSYRLALEFPGGGLQAVSGELAATMSLQLEANEVAAYLDDGQRLSGSVTVHNTGAQADKVELLATTSDHRWSAELEQAEVAIAAGAQIVIPLSVAVPADAWADHPVRVSVRASDAAGRQVEAWSDIDVGRAAPVANAELHWPIPDALRGGFNVAWLPFGAEWTPGTPAKAREPRLRDDLVFPGYSTSCCGSGREAPQPMWTLDLPGDELLPVRGFAFDAFGNQQVFRSIRRATLLLSPDGEQFTEALRVEALPVLTEQQFALPAPVPARFARLRVDSTFELPMREVGIGELKIILEPGFDLSGGRGFNLGDPALGGHLVSTLPPDGRASRILSADEPSSWANQSRQGTVQYVIGFHRDRAAQIDRVEWRYDESLGEEQRNFRKVTVSASEHSPVGPWRSLGELKLTASDTAATLNLDEPAWARFVRLEAQADPAAKRSREPGVIHIRERPGGDGYVSILTEWGEAGGRAYFELQQGIPKAETLASGNNSPDKATALTIGERTSGSVALGRVQNWYRLAVPTDVNTLSLELTGDPTVRTVLALEDESGASIPLSPTRRGRSPRTHRYEAVVEPGQNVLAQVSEPPRNVVFSWDTSGSVGAYIPRVQNSVMAFSGEVQPDREWVNLLPFGMDFLLSDWSDNPVVLQSVLNDYSEDNGSSDAEKALDLAARGLAPRPGSKAVVLVTDAVTPYYGEMWHSMAGIQPRVFGVGVAGSGIAEQNRFRDWAAVNGGDFHQLRYVGEMDVAFDRASTRMHRPADYTLLVEGEFREAPGPGKLQVVAGRSRPQSAVELILDASGSMLQRIEGKRRIAVAKEVLTEAVRKYIPAGTPLAMRVFGHKEADSCRTDLEMPLAPLDPDAAAKKIAGINAMNLARTPIADSLAAVDKDLRGSRTGAIILVTDGEETCGGDPAVAIDSLREKGLDVSLNIVGFAIDDEALAEQFEAWAESGGGRYFAAANQSGLSHAVESALRIPFRVFDQSGNEAARGEVGGDPVELEQGLYRVVVDTATPQTFDDVEVRGEHEAVLELK